MSKKEIDRYDIISRVLRKEITGVKAGVLLGLSKRHIRRMKKRVKKNGAKGLIHGNRGKPSSNRIPESECAEIIQLLKEKYPDFGPTFAAEKLFENHGITHDPKTIRSLQITEGLWKPRKGKSKEEHREWRPRKDAYGEMVQFDGCYHDWYEGRGISPKQCLLAAIDDASSTVVKSSFSAHEGVFPVFTFWKAYLLAHGKPRSIYLDKFSTYKMNHKVAIENPDLKTQFQRVCDALGIELIFAQSPQGKGRVERLFRTLQDRLVKELRLGEISCDDSANVFLEKIYLAKFNARFAVEPASKTNLHRQLTGEEKKNLDSMFSRHTQRTVQNDFTFSFQKSWYQITATQSIAVRKKDIVTVEEHMDGTTHVRLRGKELKYTVLPERPKKATQTLPWVLVPQAVRIPHKPAANHPWRRPFLVKELQSKIHVNS